MTGKPWRRTSRQWRFCVKPCLKIVVTHKTTKEMYDCLHQLYAGNIDVRRNWILDAAKDFDTIVKETNESLQDFHSRLKGYLGQLQFSWEKIPELRITHHFLEALNSKWDAVAIAFQAQTDIKNITRLSISNRFLWGFPPLRGYSNKCYRK